MSENDRMELAFMVRMVACRCGWQTIRYEVDRTLYDIVDGKTRPHVCEFHQAPSDLVDAIIKPEGGK